MTTVDDQVRLEPLATRHRPALEDFERSNREFFARHIGDRGDNYFDL